MAKLKPHLMLLFLALLPTFLIWLPFFLRLNSFWTIPLPKDGMATIVANYDGPLYIAVAKSLYDPDLISEFNFDVSKEYYAAHFPLYPLFVRIFSIPIGFPYATLLVTLLSSVWAIIIFRSFISDFVDKKDVFWITFIFSIFPARWLIVKSIGSPEPLFIALLISSVFYFKKQKFLLSGIFGGLAAMTKSPGILLFPALIAAYIYPTIRESIGIKRSEVNPFKILVNIFPLLLIPISTLSVFILYKIKINDFFAYFHSGDNIHLFFPPFQIFNPTQPWVGTFWLEEVIIVYLLGAIGILYLAKKDIVSGWFAAIFFVSTLFISHRDIVRYSLPLVPFLLAGYTQQLVKKEFKFAFWIIIIPIYLFSIAFISKNVMPIPDWGPLL